MPDAPAKMSAFCHKMRNGLPLYVAMQNGHLLFDEESEQRWESTKPLCSHGVDAVRARWLELETARSKVLSDYKTVGLFADWLNEEERKSYDKQVAAIKKGSAPMPTIAVVSKAKAPAKPTKKVDKDNDDLSLDALL
eukprot:6477313-Amphidinium_carterae.2